MEREDTKQLIAIIGVMMHHIFTLEAGKKPTKEMTQGFWDAKGLLDDLAHRYGIEHREN